MTLATLGLTLQTAGTIFIGIAALTVHHRVFTQTIIDRSVTKMM